MALPIGLAMPRSLAVTLICPTVAVLRAATTLSTPSSMATAASRTPRSTHERAETCAALFAIAIELFWALLILVWVG